jgi:hypothetical protein
VSTHDFMLYKRLAIVVFESFSCFVLSNCISCVDMDSARNNCNMARYKGMWRVMSRTAN